MSATPVVTAISADHPLTVRAVLFDLDGTLLDTLPDLHAAVNCMLADLGRPALSLDAVRSYIGRGIPNLVKRALARSLDAVNDPAPPPADALASYLHHYARENGRDVRCYPGVMEGLGSLRAAGVPLGVITNKSKAFTRPLLHAMGLEHFFDVVVSGDELPRHKPDPMALIWACGRLGVSPADAVFVGDSVNDFLAARAAGCHVFLLPYGYNEGGDVHDLACDAIVPTVQSAARLIRYEESAHESALHQPAS